MTTALTIVASTRHDPIRDPDAEERIQALKLDYVMQIDYQELVEEPIDWDTLSEDTLLSADLEAHLFRQMNLAYRTAALLRQDLPLTAVFGRQLAEIERLADRGQRLRNKLAIVFTKLTLSITCGFANPRCPLDELTSEAQTTLLYAISKFNPDRGFRFSTYATHALRRRLIRYVRRENDRREVCVDWQCLGVPESRRWTYGYEREMTATIRSIDSWLRQLAPRERYIIRSRFGWGRDFDPRTLQSIADELGVSRERVRQLEARAIKKLRMLAEAGEPGCDKSDNEASAQARAACPDVPPDGV